MKTGADVAGEGASGRRRPRVFLDQARERARTRARARARERESERARMREWQRETREVGVAQDVFRELRAFRIYLDVLN